MYQTSQSYNQAIAQNNQNTKVNGTIKLKDNTIITVTDSDILQGSLNINRKCVNKDELILGLMDANELKLALITEDNYNKFNDSIIELQFGLETAPNVWEYVPLGIFNTIECKRSGRCVALTSYDNMIKFDVANIKNNSKTANLYEFTTYACGLSGVTFGMSQAEFMSLPNANKTLQLLSNSPVETPRDLLGYVAELLGCYGCINREGELIYKTFSNATVCEITGDKRNNTSVMDFDTKINGVKMVLNNFDYIRVDNTIADGTTLMLSTNPLLQPPTTETTINEVLDNILNVVKGVNYTPFTCDYTGNPALDVGDYITLSGGLVNTETTGLITSNNWKYRGKNQLKGAGKDPKLLVRESQSKKQENSLLETFKVETNNAISLLVQGVEGNSTQISLSQGEILLKVDSAGIISAINMSPEGITIDSSKLDITGVVTFNDLLTPGKTIINGGILETCTIKWNNGDAEIGTNSDPSLGVTDTYINTPTGLMTINAGSTQITSDLDIIGKIYAPYSELDNASVGYLEINGKSIYLATDGTVRWQGGEKLETTSVKISITSTDGFILTGLSCIVNGNENPLHGTKSVVNLHYAVGTVLEVSFSSKTGYNTPESFSYTVTAEAKVFAITYTKEGDPVIPETDAKYFTFNIATQTITAFNKELALADGITQVRFPTHINGVEVKKINDIFLRVDYITAVEIPDGITELYRTFLFCYGLIFCKLPNGLETISQDLFQSCKLLEKVIMPKSLIEIGYQSFASCLVLPEITIPDSVISIEDKSFFNCDSLTEINIPNSVKIIKNGAFGWCDNLSVVNIGSGIETIEADSFRSSPLLTTININRPANSVVGAPWGATNATINWS